ARCRQDQPCGGEWHLPGQSGRFRPGQPVGRTVDDCSRFGFDVGAFLLTLWAAGVIAMIYSYTQISQYLSCPRRYRHRYLDGWQERDPRAAMLFGRAFEQAIAALFRHEDPAAALFEQWAPCKQMNLVYSSHDSWDCMLEQGIHLLEHFVQDGRVEVPQPR